MKKWVKVVAAVLLLLLGLIIVAPIVFEDKIVSKALEYANEQIEGEISVEEVNLTLLQSFPNFVLHAKELKVSNSNIQSDQEIANIGLLDLQLDMMSVVKGAPRIVGLYLHDPKLNLVIDSLGRANFDIAPKDEEASSDQNPEQATEDAAFSLDLESYGITNGSIVLKDEQSDAILSLMGIQHKGNGAFDQAKFTLNTTSKIEDIQLLIDNISYLSHARLLSDINLDIDQEARIYTLRDNFTQLNELTLKWNGSVQESGTEDLIMDLHFDSADSKFKEFLSLLPSVITDEMKDVETSGTFAAGGNVNGLYNSKSIPGFDLYLNIKDARVKYPELPESISNINVNGKVQRSEGESFDNTIVQLNDFSALLGKNPIAGHLSIKTPETDPEFDLFAKTQLNLAELGNMLPFAKETTLKGKIDGEMELSGKMSAIEAEEYEQIAAKGVLKVEDLLYNDADFKNPVEISKADLTFNPIDIKLNNFEFKSGNSQLSAVGQLSNHLAYLFNDGVLKGNLDVNSSNLDLDNIFNPATSAVNEEAQDTLAQASPSLPSVPEKIDFISRVDLKKLRMNGVDYTKIKGALRIKDGSAVLEKMNMQAFDGYISGKALYNTKKSSSSQPEVKLNLNLKEIDIPRLFRSYTVLYKAAPILGQSSGEMGGKLQFESKLDAQLNPIYSSTQSVGKLRTSDLRLSSSGLIKEMGKVFKMEALQNNPKVEDLNLSYVITNGKMKLSPVNLSMSGIKGQLSGTTDLNAYEMDMLAQLKVPRTMLKGNINDVIDKASAMAKKVGIKVDIGEYIEVKSAITGPPNNPSYSILYGETEAGSPEEYLQKEADKLLEEVKKKGINNVLKGLFGQ